MTWQHGRHRPHSPAWAAVCAAVRQRAGGQCERVSGLYRCPYAGVQVDHVTPYFEGGADTIDNAEYLCKIHHDDKTSTEANRAAQAARDRGKRPPERHPLDYPSSQVT